MSILTVNKRSQIKLSKDVLKHLGINPGDKIELDLVPDKKVVIKASAQT
jgi:bifunctional DNA-binding transcriptional regulator/antitoxin component of YhaV-PrlF toxin-antitoxin module